MAYVIMRRDDNKGKTIEFDRMDSEKEANNYCRDLNKSATTGESYYVVKK